MDIGNKAYQMVCAYSKLGDHRTGQVGDQQTVRWLANMLEDIGAEVTLQNFPYHHFDVELTITVDNKHIEAIALYYSFTGRHKIRNAAMGTINAHADENVISHKIDTMVSEASERGCDGLLLATECPTNALSAINRKYNTGFNFPVILMSKGDLENIRMYGASIECSATIRTDEASNVIARFDGPSGGRKIIVTTPISGWFDCAGERGCGIAIAILVAKKLSKDFAVDLLLASGHELGFLGGHHIAQNYSSAPSPILHLGSCIANIDAQFTCICSAEPTLMDKIAMPLQRLGIKPIAPLNPTDADNWVGESECWASRELPMLSIAGLAPHFHTPDDLPETVTNPQLLADTIDAIYDAAIALED